MVTLAALLSMSASNYSEKLRRKVAELVGEVNGGEREGLCRPTYDIWSINRDVQEIAEKEPKYLVLGGGDGSVFFYSRRLKEIYGQNPLPKMIYLPIGRENRLGYELGNSRKPIKLLEEIVEGIKEGRDLEEEKMSLIEARIDEGKKVPTFEVGFGFITNLLLHYYGMRVETIKRRKEDEFRNRAYPRRRRDSFKTFGGAVFNALRYWTETAKEYFGGTIVEIKTEKANYGKQYWLGGMMATNRHLWRGFKPMYRGREQAEKMHLIVTGRAPVWLALKLLRLYRGGPIGGRTIDEVVGKTELVFGEPTVIQMAGEFFVAEKVELGVEKEGICFVKPAKKRR